MKQKLNCILLIDDDEASNFLNNIILEDADCALLIKTQQTATAALHYIAESGQLTDQQNTLPFPDLIFLDINMPAMDGWEFLLSFKELRNNLPHTPVIIMLSTSINPDDKLRALTIEEVSAFYNKPITPGIISSILSKYFHDYI